MWSENESARHAFAVFASAALLRAEHRRQSAVLRALLIESKHIKAEFRSLPPMKKDLETHPSDNLNNRLCHVWLTKAHAEPSNSL
jgi:hypothetical protein